jgi:hypothetical protein
MPNFGGKIVIGGGRAGGRFVSRKGHSGANEQRRSHE